MAEQSLSDKNVVTHQHSGDPAIFKPFPVTENKDVVTHQHSGDPAIVPHLKPL